MNDTGILRNAGTPGAPSDQSAHSTRRVLKGDVAVPTSMTIDPEAGAIQLDVPSKRIARLVQLGLHAERAERRRRQRRKEQKAARKTNRT